MTELAKNIVASAVAAGNVKVPSGLIRVAAIQSMLANTNGVETETRSTIRIYVHFTSMTEGEKPREGVEELLLATPGWFRFDGFGNHLGQGAIDSMKAVPFEGKSVRRSSDSAHRTARIAPVNSLILHQRRERSPTSLRLGGNAG